MTYSACLKMTEGDSRQAREPGRAPLRARIGLPGSAVLLLVPLILGLLVYLVVAVIGSPCRINGDSMYPTLNHGDRALIMKYYFGRTPERGDVVSLEDVTGESLENIMKRVVAVGGDSITYQGGFLIVNSEQAYENLINVFHAYTETVPENTVFVLGDNESVSYDSRHFGLVPVDKVEGRAVLVFWPLENFKGL